MGQRIWFLGTTLLFVGSLALLIAAYAAEENGVARAIPVLTLFVAIPSFVSLVLECWLNRRIHITQDLPTTTTSLQDEQDNDESLLPKADQTKMMQLLETGLRPTATSVSLYIGPSVSLFLIVLVRLVASPETFQGDPSLLDFGPKYGEKDGEPNVSFTPEFNSVGHCLQGILAAMLVFPAVSGVFTQVLTCKWKAWWTECNKILLCLIQVVACCMTIYPTYNLVKRLIRSAETFATSSFCNNSFEWAFGFMVGLALGNLASVLVKQCITRKVDGNFQATLDRANGSSWVLGTQKPLDFQPKVTGFIFIMGLVLMATVFVAAVAFGLTWHSCEDGGDDCVNYSKEGIAVGVLATLVMIPTVVITAVSCGDCVRFRR